MPHVAVLPNVHYCIGSEGQAALSRHSSYALVALKRGFVLPFGAVRGQYDV